MFGKLKRTETKESPQIFLGQKIIGLIYFSETSFITPVQKTMKRCDQAVKRRTTLCFQLIMYNFQILQRFFLSSDCQFGKISYSHYQALAQNREVCAPIGIQGQALLERYTYTLHVLSGVFVSVKKKRKSLYCLLVVLTHSF